MVDNIELIGRTDSFGDEICCGDRVMVEDKYPGTVRFNKDSNSYYVSLDEQEGVADLYSKEVDEFNLKIIHD